MWWLPLGHGRQRTVAACAASTHMRPPLVRPLLHVAATIACGSIYPRAVVAESGYCLREVADFAVVVAALSCCDTPQADLVERSKIVASFNGAHQSFKVI
ncbi:hypothetical protein B296_00051129 [Ensete ventricosum]|uniref:Uncharacterized protein n=1 Tax=Ensete ventricosum TaxID=4639 RepID=A0A426YI99_ENSVE|nr:hypothetical protein B296_00051129 [Ensete ventricosum]